MHAQGDRRQLERLYQTISKWIFAFNFPVFLIVVLFPTELLGLFGKTFTEGATALTILAWASLVDAATGMCGSGTGLHRFSQAEIVQFRLAPCYLTGAQYLVNSNLGHGGRGIGSIGR